MNEEGFQWEDVDDYDENDELDGEDED